MSDPAEIPLMRVDLLETDDSGKQQMTKLRGRAGEQFGGESRKVPKAQGYGFSAHPPKGSHGLVLMIAGYQPIALALEHADSRPTDLKEGEVLLYDDQGQKVQITRDGITITTDKPVIIKGAPVHINP
jgi:phage gp45-like